LYPEVNPIGENILLPGFFPNQPSAKLFIKPMYRNHPEISGNKWYKLKYNLLEAKQKGLANIITFGGAYSNHLVAVASACRLMNLRAHLIIRGENPEKPGKILQWLLESQAQLYFVSRTAYREKESHPEIQKLLEDIPNGLLLPEGGTNALAVKGCMEILDEADKRLDIIALACGTGGTAAGLLSSIHQKQQLWVFPVLKDASYLKDRIIELTHTAINEFRYNQLNFFQGSERKGYGKTDSDLEKFILEFRNKYTIPLEHVYTAKSLLAIQNISKKFDLSGKSVLFVHTGGIHDFSPLNAEQLQIV
jgi:1-aminocyclopropane-1-carboxylate deaminase